MTSITNFSEDLKFTIKNVSAQTGILPITLRAWERRYQIITPRRSSNRYRLYSERDIAILHWLKSRVDHGILISTAAAELSQMIKNGTLPDAVPIELPLAAPQPAPPPEKYAHALYRALIRHDEVGASSLLRKIVSTVDLKTIIMEVFTPCLVRIGEAWYRGEIRISTEHFASVYLRGKLLTLFQAYPAPRGAPKIMVGGAPTEEHEIGALMMAVLMRSAGYAVEFLGTDIPLDDLVDHARSEKPAMIILTATMPLAAVELKHMQEKLSRLRPAPIFGYGGFAFNMEPDLQKQVPGIFLGETMDRALKTIAQLLGPGKSAQPRGKLSSKSETEE